MDMFIFMLNDKIQNNFTRRCIVFCILGLCILSACIKQSEEIITMNMPYHDARKIILKSGWIPTTDFRDEIIQNDIEKYGHLHPFLKLGYEELGACTGMGTAYCDFYFTNGKDKYLRVITQGEDNGPGSNMQTGVIYIGLVEDEVKSSEDDSIKGYWDPIGDNEYRSRLKDLKGLLEKK